VLVGKGDKIFWKNWFCLKKYCIDLSKYGGRSAMADLRQGERVEQVTALGR
jgi:hypothetical protein